MKSAVLTDVISEGALLVEEEFDSLREVDGTEVTWSRGSYRPLPRSPQAQVTFQSSEALKTTVQGRYYPPPKTILLGNLADRRLKLNGFLPVVLQYGEESVTACSYDLEDFGVGATEFEALADLQATIVELYFSLKEDQGRLGAQPEKEWAFLRSIVQET